MYYNNYIGSIQTLIVNVLVTYICWVFRTTQVLILLTYIIIGSLDFTNNKSFTLGLASSQVYNTDVLLQM